MTRTAAVIAVLVAAPLAGEQSLTFSKGQNISPAYEGWEQAADGTKYFLFGYMNRTWEEEIDVPIGPDNGFGPGAADQGQPTHFLPRRNRFVFRVRVPDGFGAKDELVWTLATHGKTEKAYASLRPDYVVDDVVKASETGALGAGTSSPEVRANKPPVVAIEAVGNRSVTVGEAVRLLADVNDDGIPKLRVPRPAQGRASTPAAPAVPGVTRTPPGLTPPTRITVGKISGLHASWFVYRGAGRVTFDPPQIEVWEDTRSGANSPWAPLWTAPKLPTDGRIEVRVTFDEPGTYVLRCRADDGALTADEGVTIVVTR